MDLRPKCKLRNYITGENIDDLGNGDDLLNEMPKAWSMKELIVWTYLKFKTSGLRKTVSREQDKLQTAKKNLQRTSDKRLI